MIATARFVVAEDPACPGLHPTHVVRTWRDAGRVVMDALAGASPVVLADAPREVIDGLVDDLRHLGTVDHRVGGSADPVRLSDDEQALLVLLLDGRTLGQAAADLFWSRRTADRRLASARAALGASSTAEALARAHDLGIRGTGR